LNFKQILKRIFHLISILIKKSVFTIRDPVFDLDRDGHSDHKSLRGSDWVGKDCNDYDSNIRPGRKVNGQDLLLDTNCNGIYVIYINS